MNKDVNYTTINDDDLEKIQKVFKTTKIKLKKGTILTKDNYFNYRIGVILCGVLDIIKHDYNGEKIILEKLGQSDVIGDIFIPDNFHEVSVVVTSNCSILFIDFDSFLDNYDKTINYNSLILYSMLKFLVKTTMDKDNRIKILTKNGLRDRLIEYFNILYYKNSSVSFRIPYSYTELAVYLSVNRSSMTRELKRMCDDGLICLKDKKVTLNYMEN